MKFRHQKTIFLLILAATLAGCKSSAGLLGPPDETEEAKKLVISANAELKKIKILYEDNENKREEIKQAIASGDAATVQKLSGEVVELINEGAGLGKSALDKIDEARDLQINEDYKDYLGLKWEALNKQLEAFEEYRQAARELRNKYDPKNTEVRDAVAAEFKRRSENYQRLMEKARDHSSEANELAKRVMQRKTEE